VPSPTSVGAIAAQVAPDLAELRAGAGLAPNPDLPRELLLTLAPASLDDSAGRQQTSVRRFRLPAAPDATKPEAWGDPESPLVYVSFGTEVPFARPTVLPGPLPRRVGRARKPARAAPHDDLRPARPGRTRSGAGRRPGRALGRPGRRAARGPRRSSGTAEQDRCWALSPRASPWRSLNAARVVHLGAGLALDGEEAATAALTAAVRELLADSDYRAAARRIADDIAALPPIDEAVEVLAALSERR
jgi:hypothetical protein